MSCKKEAISHEHNQQNCDCFNLTKATSDRWCIYAEFPDGWSFVPAVGNAQSRGEVFTGLPIVQHMITTSGMLPEAAVYYKVYETSVSEAEEYCKLKINEPAVGTANFSATILYHKLEYARVASTRNNLLELPKYHKWLLEAVASLYMFDIDCGNLQTTKQRLLGLPTPLNHHTAQSYWREYLETWLYFSHGKKPTKKVAAAIASQVEASLDEAHKNWNKFTKTGKGVIDTAYETATGESMPQALKSQVKDILDKNAKFFNGIVREDTKDASKGFYCPGWVDVNWVWWEFREVSGNETDFVQSKKRVSLKNMILTGELEELKKAESATSDSTELKAIRKKITALETELYGVNTPGSLFG